MNPACEHLEDYLTDDLSKDQRSGFEAHLDDCHECRGRVERQRRIDRLLVLGLERFEPVPASLIHAVDARIHSSRRRRASQLAWGVSSCVVLALLLGLWSTYQPPERFIQEDPVSVATDQLDHGPTARTEIKAEDRVRITLSDPAAAILVPVKSEAPNVSIVWIYPTLKPAGGGKGNDLN